jgi:hypothetical protein
MAEFQRKSGGVMSTARIIQPQVSIGLAPFAISIDQEFTDFPIIFGNGTNGSGDYQTAIGDSIRA